MLTPEEAKEVLKPCPFCGASADVLVETYEFNGAPSSHCEVRCSDPHNACPARPLVTRGAKDEAIAAWNTRYIDQLTERK